MGHRYRKYLLPEDQRNYELELGEYLPEFRERYVEISKHCDNFDSEQVARSFDEGMTIERTIAMIREDEADNDPVPVDFEDVLGRDMLMNG
jgi:hypothetical protein